MKPKLLIVELWGVGDLAIATPFLRAAAERFEVTLLAKPFAEELQPRFWPGVRVKTFIAPWTAFRGKYRFYRWPWKELFALREELRRENFDVGLSARWDPRDHFLLDFFGVEKRLGFPRIGSGIFLTDSLNVPELTAHRYEFWRLAAKSLDIELPPRGQIALPPRSLRQEVLVHTGAGQPVRVWPLENYQQMVQRLRADGRAVQVVCDPDQRERWLQLGESHVATPKTITELMALLDRAGIFIGNDSGPGHLAAMSNVPTFTFFGPQLSERFAPLHPQAEWIDGLACPFKPCQDYCRFPTPRCLWDISEESVWPRVKAFAQSHLAGSARIQRQTKIIPADLCYSIADQNVATTKSIGIYNFSVRLARILSERAEFRNLTVLSNRTISPGLHLPPGVRLENHDSAIRGKIGRILWDQRGVYQKARATRLPWLFLPKGFCSFSVRPPVNVAAYVHDVMGDFYHRRYPGFWPKWESLYFSRSLAATFRHARVIFTNTEFSKNEMTAVAARMRLSPRKIVVAGYGFDARTAGPVNKENRVVLFASQWPHKRTDIALRFLNCWLRESNYDGIIDCIGIFPPEMEKPAGPNWNWIGRVPPAQGREMMRRARAIVYVSEYEGFGMPPMEAILEGTCPVFSDIPPLREVMNGAGHSFSNDSEESFARAMQAALSTPPETIRAWSEQLFQRHNWQRVVEKILPELSEI